MEPYNPASPTRPVSVERILGRRETFAAFGGRCSAAEAVQFRRLREEKQYLKLSRSWEQFCDEHLQMSRSNVDRIIGLLEEFGADYFAIAQFTRVSPETYRLLARSVRDGVLSLEGESIALIPENAAAIGAAVRSARTRKSIERSAPPEPASYELVAAIERRTKETIQDFRTLRRRHGSTSERHHFGVMLSKVIAALKELETELNRE